MQELRDWLTWNSVSLPINNPKQLILYNEIITDSSFGLFWALLDSTVLLLKQFYRKIFLRYLKMGLSTFSLLGELNIFPLGLTFLVARSFTRG